MNFPLLKIVLLELMYWNKMCQSFEEFYYDDNLDTIDTMDTLDLSHYGSAIYAEPDQETGRILEESNSKHPEELGRYVQGDLLIPKNPMLRNGIIYESYWWPQGIVPFEISGSFSANEMTLIEKSLIEYHTKTCIKFVPRRNSDIDYISIQNERTGCWSSVGKVGNLQIVNLQSPGCVTKIGTILHELMHAIGFMHEHTREERDENIYIIKGNIKKGFEENFNKVPTGITNSFGIGYDFGSIMHYSSTAFSSNKQPTIVPRKKTNGEMGQRDGFSQLDIEKINRMYKCKSKITTTNVKYPESRPQSSTFTGADIINFIWNLVSFNASSKHDLEEMVDED